VAKFTLTIEDLPEGSEDLLTIKMDVIEKSDDETPTPAEYITCLILEIVDQIQKGASIDSLSEVQN